MASTRADVECLAVDRHLPAAAQHVINLIFFLPWQPIPEPGLSARFRKTSFRSGRLAEEGVADRLASTAVRAGLLLGHVAVAFEDVAPGRRFLRGRTTASGRAGRSRP